MKKFVFLAFLTSFAVTQPMHATEILSILECVSNPMQVFEQIICSSGTFETYEARRLLFQIKEEVKEHYGIDLDLNLVMNQAISVMIDTGQFSEAEIKTAKRFYSQLIESEINTFSHWKFGKKKHKQKEDQDFILPDKMAVGFVCIFSGTLLCLLPLGITQGIGTGLIGTGIYSILDGVREGERPYYVDSVTENSTPSNHQNTRPSNEADKGV